MVESTLALEDAPVDVPVSRYSLGQVEEEKSIRKVIEKVKKKKVEKRKAGEKSAISMDDNLVVNLLNQSESCPLSLAVSSLKRSAWALTVQKRTCWCRDKR